MGYGEFISRGSYITISISGFASPYCAVEQSANGYLVQSCHQARGTKYPFSVPEEKSILFMLLSRRIYAIACGGARLSPSECFIEILRRSSIVQERLKQPTKGEWSI